jgi:single-strand selective monofunctional uracil DNA glycosylase
MGQAERLIRETRALRRTVAGMRFSAPVSHVYNPIDYAMRPHNTYLRRFAGSAKRVVFLGMNPGPYGMAQTGVPFGEVTVVRDWLGIEGPVSRPAIEHPKRPVQGFDCARSEVSGSRVWGAIRDHYGTPERFFRQNFIANYCPLVFMEASGRNCTPDKLPARERERLFAVCDDFLRRLVEILQPERVVGIGAFAARRAEEALAGSKVGFGQILHPSPANPRANRDWVGEVRRQLREQAICAG